MSPSRLIRRGWRLLRDGLGGLGIGRQQLERIAMPPVRALARLPGPAGLFFDQTADQFDRDARIRQALEDFERDLSAMTSDSVCIDPGTKLGDVTARMAAVAGVVHAFEPDPTAFALLRARLGHLHNVHLHNAAVSTVDGTLQLYRHAEAETAPKLTRRSSILAGGGARGATSAIETACVDFRRVLRALGQRVALVKMDVEGAEIALLEALLPAPELDLVDAIRVETHAWMHPEQLVPLARLRRAFAGRTRPRVNVDWP